MPIAGGKGADMTETKQVTLEYHRAGSSLLFSAGTIAGAVKGFLTRYPNAANRTRLLVHTRSILQDGETMVFGELVHEGTFSLEALRAVCS